MSSLELVVCMAAGVFLGQGDKKEPSPDRLVTIKEHQVNLPMWVHPDFQHQKESMLMIDRINFGIQFHKPSDSTVHGHPDKDLSRFAGCYFHPLGPAGIALKKIDWFPSPLNLYWADARFPASLVAQVGNGLPGVLVNLWSEPPYAILGIDAGSLASFARPYQTVHCIERIPIVVQHSTPSKGKDPTFTFIRDAKERGACINLEQGELRPTLERKKIQGFYHLMFIQPHKDGERTIQKELFTKEGMAALMATMAEEGVICFHTSSRYFEFPKLIADACKEGGLVCKRGHDSHWNKNLTELIHFTSEWVMVARKTEYLQHLVTPAGYKSRPPNEPYWTVPEPPGLFKWTDKGKNSMKGMVRSDPMIGSQADSLYDILDIMTSVGIPQSITGPIIQELHQMMQRYGQELAKNWEY